ncbi:unnamed protein product [Fusarium graminearum]|nr:unnamed protein product [Fusarium graminearum]CAG1966690.1 unnamed protein product [Fusarium graminearum]VTO85675.1 unnamed protein product [Fusarium graminearum]
MNWVTFDVIKTFQQGLFGGQAIEDLGEDHLSYFRAEHVSDGPVQRISMVIIQFKQIMRNH